jgi:acid phosphatase
MSSFPPRAPYSEKELQKLYPSNLKLQQVQILLRHGERAPTSARFEHAGLAAFWPYCSAAKQLLSVTMNNNSSSWSALQWRRHLETFDSDDNPVVVSGPQGEIDVMCNFGELTDQGRRSSHALGTCLRHLYVDQLRFLPSTLRDPEMIYLRATRIPRALESLQETFWGMYPPQSRSESFPPPAIILRAPTDETLNPNNGYCKRFAQLAQAFARRSADRWNTSTEMDYLDSLIGKWMPENSKRVAIDSQPRLSGILDTINSTLAHGPGTKLPKEFYDQKGMAIINRLVIEEWFSGYNESQEYRALGIGSLMGDIVSRMVVSVERNSKEGFLEVRESDENSSSTKGRKTAIKLGLSGCHDTTLAAILTSLGAFKIESWPQYTSHIALEFFRKLDTPEGSASRAWKADKISSAGATDYHSTVSGWFRQVFGLNSGRALDEKRDVSKASAIARQKIDTLPPSERSKLDGYYVRIRYNDKPVTVPGCKASGKHLESDESFCTLEAFKAIVDKFTPLHWKQDCWSNLNGPTFPAKPEPAGY